MKAIKSKRKVKIVEKPGQKFIEILKRNSKKPQRPKYQDPNCLMGNTENWGTVTKMK